MGTYQISLFTAVATVALTILFVIGLFVSALQVKQKKKLESLRQQLVSGISGLEDQQRNIGRELHDGVGSLMTISTMYLKRLKDKIGESGDEFNEVLGYLEEMHKTIRNSSHRLTPARLQDEGLKAGLEDLVGGFSAAQPEVEFHVTVMADSFVLGENAIHIYRMIQEMLQNSMRHSECRSVNIRIEEKKGRLRVEYFDDGKGFNTEANRGGTGLTNIRARCEILHGQLELFTIPGKGTEYILLIPLKQEA